MKATDLRIGNYLIDRQDRLCQVEAIKPHDYEDYLFDFDAPAITGAITGLPHKPILLTEEWLVKFGFVKDGKLLTLNIIENVNLVYCLSNSDIVCDIINTQEGLDHNCNDIYQETHLHIMASKYVHQLQNLYFALTGKELEI